MNEPAPIFRTAGQPDDVDPRPGLYYICCVDAGRFGLLAGPYTWHGDALADVDRVKAAANRADAWSWFHAFGTCRCDGPRGPGVLNAAVGLPPEGRPELVSPAARLTPG